LLLLPVVAETQEQRTIQDEGPAEHLIYTPDDIEWQPGPGSFQAGAEFAVLEGDPSQPGVFTMQIRMPDGFVIAPHWHPGVERVTVLSGAFHLGHGDALDREAAQRLPAGSHFSLPQQRESGFAAESSWRHGPDGGNRSRAVIPPVTVPHQGRGINPGAHAVRRR
jgi:hypothetical protein